MQNNIPPNRQNMIRWNQRYNKPNILYPENSKRKKVQNNIHTRQECKQADASYSWGTLHSSPQNSPNLSNYNRAPWSAASKLQHHPSETAIRPGLHPTVMLTHITLKFHVFSAPISRYAMHWECQPLGTTYIKAGQQRISDAGILPCQVWNWLECTQK